MMRSSKSNWSKCKTKMEVLLIWLLWFLKTIRRLSMSLNWDRMRLSYSYSMIKFQSKMSKKSSHIKQIKKSSCYCLIVFSTTINNIFWTSNCSQGYFGIWEMLKILSIKLLSLLSNLKLSKFMKNPNLRKSSSEK